MEDDFEAFESNQPTQGKPKAGGKRGSGGKAASAKICFVCPEKQRSHSKWCAHHHKMVECMRHQAGRDGKRALVDSALSDPEKARLCLTQFEKESPPGAFRKKPIEWSAFEKSFGKRHERRHREEEELMDISDYVHFRRGRVDEQHSPEGVGFHAPSRARWRGRWPHETVMDQAEPPFLC